jgi:hypothetical protein
MKKGILLITIIAGIGLYSFVNGPGANGYDCTGAETGLGNPTGCATGPTGCHNTIANPDVELSLKIDSAGAPISFYTPGVVYTLTVTGKNHIEGSHLPKFGFQVGVIRGITPGPMVLNAGLLQDLYLPAGLRYKGANTASFRINMVEHVYPLPVTTGSGDTGSTYKESFTWKAPVGADTVSVWAAMLLANGDNGASYDAWKTHHITVMRKPIPAGVPGELSAFSMIAVPNPVYNTVQLMFSNASTGAYSVSVYDLFGKKITSQEVLVNTLSHNITIDASSWAPGLYVAVAEKDGARHIIQFVKN